MPTPDEDGAARSPSLKPEMNNNSLAENFDPLFYDKGRNYGH